MGDPAAFRRSLPDHSRLRETQMHDYTTPYSAASNRTIDSRERPLYLGAGNSRGLTEPRLYHGYAAPERPGSAHTTYQAEHAAFSTSASIKPSLPPLRTILADTSASPPATPSSSRVLLQPSFPGQPSTLLPCREPAAYVSKRSHPSYNYDYDPARTSPQSLASAATSRSVTSPCKRRDSVARMPQDDAPRRPEGRLGWSQSMPSGTFHAKPDTSYANYECMRRTDPGPCIQPHISNGLREHARLPDTNQDSRLPSMRDDQSMRTLDSSAATTPESHSRPLDYPSNYQQPHSISMNHGPDAYVQSQQPYMGTQPYEYQGSKARKRSNLPKQSTEIMKRWFDENMENPYPSEEQKRYFAAAANINLTQVSNWFINHRRRCPELQDKRQRGSNSGRDEVY